MKNKFKTKHENNFAKLNKFLKWQLLFLKNVKKTKTRLKK